MNPNLPTPPEDCTSDERQLATFGYRQQLRRTMGAFSSFAISFSLISITTGIFANFGFGLRQVGPSMIWSWSVVVLGQLLTALVIADLATRFPLSGYGYQWTSRLLNPHFGYFVGWLLLLQFLTGFPGVCNALAAYLQVYVDATIGIQMSVPWLTVLVIAAIAVIHLAGIWLASRVNDFGVVAELAGSVVITVVLLAWFGLGADDVWGRLIDRTNFTTGNPAGISAFALSLLLGAWCLTGFEAAADLAEETRRPTRTVPWAVVGSELSSGIMGFLLLAGFLLAIRDLSAVQGSDTPLTMILQDRFGDHWTALAMIIVFISIFACGVASMAATTRLIFSLARDDMLPASGLLARIHPGRQTPALAIIAVAFTSSAVVLAIEKLELITSISATAGYLGYACIIIAALRDRTAAPPDASFRLGRWRRPIGVAALVWTLIVVFALTVPAQDGHRYALWSTVFGIAVGVVLYLALIRRRIQRGAAGPPAGRLSPNGNSGSTP